MQLGAGGVGDEIGESGLSESGGAAEEDVIQRLAAHLGGFDHDEELFFDLGLAVELGEIRRAEGEIKGRVGFVERGIHCSYKSVRGAECKAWRVACL